MTPVESPQYDLRRLRRGGGIERKNSTPKRRPDGDDLCAICDDGGDVICCDGVCQRSFHLADGNSERSRCREILRLSAEQAKMILAADKDFICKNCKYQEHQCFACGKLGSSDLSSEAEVFQCEVDDCGHFYHPKCVAKLLYPDSEDKATLFEVQVAVAREKFTCPMHECIVCKGGENKNDRNMQFAVCRRCPTTYHRMCLPSNIPFETKEGPNGYMQRAWDTFEGPDGQVIHRDRILIYCMKHPIVKKLKTPKWDHIIFPDVKKIRVPKMVVGTHNEDDIPEEEEPLEPDDIYPRKKSRWSLNHLSLLHLNLLRQMQVIRISAPVLVPSTHLHQRPCLCIHIQALVVGLVTDRLAALLTLTFTNTPSQ